MSQITVTISGSYNKHFDRLIEAKHQFEELGARVLRPHSETIDSVDEDLIRLVGDPEDARTVQQAQLDAIARSDLVYVVNPGGPIGPSATMEIGYAHRAGTPVITSEVAFERAVALVTASVGTPSQALAYITKEGDG